MSLASRKKKILSGLALMLSGAALATPSPAPDRAMPLSLEGSIATFLGNVRGAYQDLKFGRLLYDNGPNPLEEKATGEVRRWVFQAAGGTITIGANSYLATCIRTKRINVMSPLQEFYYEYRVSALEGSCTEDDEARQVDLVFQMSDFVVNKFNSGTAKFFGQSADILLYPTPLRVPERVEAVPVENGYFLAGKLAQRPPVADLHLELLLRPKGEMSCHKSKFDPARDPYSSVLVTPDLTGKWGATVPKIGGAICMRLVGGGWQSAVSAAALPGGEE